VHCNCTGLSQSFCLLCADILTSIHQCLSLNYNLIEDFCILCLIHILLSKLTRSHRVVLELFLLDIIQTGQVTVPEKLIDFDSQSSDRSAILLQDYHKTDALHLPGSAPDFHPDAALWAARYIFSTIQLVLLRDSGEDQINHLLVPYEGKKSAEEIYSADLMLRFLPDLFNFASGLSPEDPLVNKLKETAACWPFSSVGIDSVTVSPEVGILEHPALKQEYIDRIIQRKDLKRLKGIPERKLLETVLGMHQEKLWPKLNLILDEEQTT